MTLLFVALVLLAVLGILAGIYFLRTGASARATSSLLVGAVAILFLMHLADRTIDEYQIKCQSQGGVVVSTKTGAICVKSDSVINVNP